MDVDFLVTAGVHATLSGIDAAAALADDTGVHRQAIVLPAFETGPDMDARAGSDAAASAAACAKPSVPSQGLCLVRDCNRIESSLPLPRGNSAVVPADRQSTLSTTDA